jgi:hypothetical protein
MCMMRKEEKKRKEKGKRKEDSPSTVEEQD